VGISGLPNARLTAHETPQSLGANTERERAQTALTGSAVAGRAADQLLDIDARRRAQAEQEADEETQRADRIAVLSGDNVGASWISSTLNDPEKSPFLVEGQDVVDMPRQVLADFDKVAEATAARMNPRQREAYAVVRAKQKLDLQHRLEQHAFAAMNRHADSEVGKKLENVVSMAGIHAGDLSHGLSKARATLQEGIDALTAQLSSRGFGPTSETAKGEILTLQTKVHATVINRLVQQDRTQDATAYFRAANAAGEIHGEAVDDLAGLVEQGTLRGQAQKSALEIVRAGGTNAEQLEKVNGIEDPKLQDEVRGRVKMLHDEQKSFQIEARHQNNLTVYDYLDSRGATLDGLQKVAGPDGVPIWHSMTGGERNAAESYLSQKASTTVVEPGGTEYYRLRNMVDDDPTKFLETDIFKSKHRMSKGEFDKLFEIRSKMKAGKAQAASETIDPDGPQVRRIFEDTWAQYTLTDVSVTAQEQAKDPTMVGRISFMRRVVGEEVARLPKTATNDDVQNIVSRVFSEQVTATRGGFWGPKTETKNIYDLTIADVPAAEKAKIVEAFRIAGLDVSDAAILSAYLKRLVRRK